MIGYLYKLDFVSGKSYIGITAGKLAARIQQHRCDAMKGRSQLPVHRAWRKHGAPKVTVLVIAAADYLLELERRAVAAYNTFKGGYNASPGGDLVPVMTPEIRAKIGAKARGRKASEETRRKLSLAHTGRTHSPESKARMVESYKQRPPPTAKAKALKSERISKAKRGKKLTAEQRAAMSARLKGVPKTAAHNAAIALARWREHHASMLWAFNVGVDRQSKLDLTSSDDQHPD
jgi:hypothetical protein